MELTFLCVITNVDHHVRSMLTHRGGGPMGRASQVMNIIIIMTLQPVT